jgi:hypothetical protein
MVRSQVVESNKPFCISFAAVSFSKLKTSNFWCERTYEVLATALTFLSDLFSI